MKDLTKREIRRTFVELIEKMPYKKVTVAAIVKECGINRNTFYYHYNDLPELIQDIAKRKIDRFIMEGGSVKSLDDIQEAVVNDMFKEKKAVLNIYNSANRELFEFFLWDIVGMHWKSLLCAV